ncbi:ribonuclease H-like domain-containing protein [Tanacetum coccineum]
MEAGSSTMVTAAKLPNVAFVSSNNSGSSNQAYGSNSANTDSMSDVVIYSFFANQSNSPQLNDEDLQQIDVDDLEEMDLKWQMAMLTWQPEDFYKYYGKEDLIQLVLRHKGLNKSKVECYNCHKKGHFARECRAPRENRNREPVRRNVTVETTETKALVAQDGLGYDWSDQAEEGPTNFALMAYTSSGSSSSSSSDSEENERYKTSEEYHAVPPHYTGNFMPPKYDLILADEGEYVFSESVTSIPDAATSEAKTSVSKTKCWLKKKVIGNGKRKEVKNSTRAKRILDKVGSTSRVESSNDVSLGAQEDASKQGRKIVDLDADAEVTLVDETQKVNEDNLMFDTGVLKEREIEFEKMVEETVVSVATTTKSIPVQCDAPVTNAGKVLLCKKIRSILQGFEAKEIRRKLPTKLLKEKSMFSTYLTKKYGGYKHSLVESKKPNDEIQILFDKEMKRVNTFVDMNSEVVKGIINDKEAQDIAREELKIFGCWVKEKHEINRPIDEYERVLWGDMKSALCKIQKMNIKFKGGLLGLKYFKIFLELLLLSSPLSSIIIADWKTIFDEIPACLTTLPHHRILDLTGNQHRICYFTYLGFVKEDETVIVSSNKNQEARDLLQLRW